MGTKFFEVYNCFLDKITDDMYMELTPADTVKDLQNMLLSAIPRFEFPRVWLDDYVISVETKEGEDVLPGEFVIGWIWNEIGTDGFEDDLNSQPVVVDNSYFAATLTREEMHILATLMVESWVQRQVTSIENTRMKYSGSDFKFTSQANHLSKLMSLLAEMQRQSKHLQRLYKRRRTVDNRIESNWKIFNHHSEDYKK